MGNFHCGILLLRPEDALRLVDDAEAAEVKVYGLDAFRLHPDDKVQPCMEFDVNGAHAASRARLQERRDSPYWFEVTFDDE